MRHLIRKLYLAGNGDSTGSPTAMAQALLTLLNRLQSVIFSFVPVMHRCLVRVDRVSVLTTSLFRSAIEHLTKVIELQHRLFAFALCALVLCPTQPDLGRQLPVAGALARALLPLLADWARVAWLASDGESLITLPFIIA